MAEGALSGFATGFGRGLARTGELSLEKKIREDIEKLKLEQEEARQQKRQLQDLKSFGDFFGVPGDPTIDPTAYRKNLTEAAAKKDYTIEFGSGGSVKITEMSPKDKILRDMTPEQQVIAAGGVQQPTMASVYERLLTPPPIPPGRTTPVGGGGGVFPTVEAAPSVVPTEPPLTTTPQIPLGSAVVPPTREPSIRQKVELTFLDFLPKAVQDFVLDPQKQTLFTKFRGKETRLSPQEYISKLRAAGAAEDKIAAGLLEEFGEFPFKQAGPMRKGDIPEAFNSLGTPPKFF